MLAFFFHTLAFNLRPILYYTAFLMSKVNCDSLLWNVGDAIIYRMVRLRDAEGVVPYGDCAWGVERFFTAFRMT